MIEVHNNVATLVVVGSWNRDIFTSDWVKENVLNGLDFQVLFPMNSFNSLKFDVPSKYSFAINANRLEFSLHDSSESASREILTPVRNLLRSLIHTPIATFGINFVFKSDENAGLLTELPHTEDLKKTMNAEISSIEMVRSLSLCDGNVLNFKINQRGEDVFFDFNFSFNAENIKKMLKILGDNDEIINEKREVAVKLLKEVYSHE